MVIIVAGGWEESSKLSAVEILDESANEWQTGLDLSFGIDNCQKVEVQNGGVVLSGGNSKPNPNLNFLYKLCKDACCADQNGTEVETLKISADSNFDS